MNSNIRHNDLSKFLPIESRFNIIELILSVLSLTVQFIAFTVIGQGIIHNDDIFLLRFSLILFGIVISLFGLIHSLISIMIRKRDIPYPLLISTFVCIFGIVSIIICVIIIPFTVHDDVNTASNDAMFYFQRTVGCCYIHLNKQNCGCYKEVCSDCENVLMPIINGLYSISLIFSFFICGMFIISLILHHINNIKFTYQFIYSNYFSNSNYHNIN